MKTATFTRCVDDADCGVIVGWFDGNYSSTSIDNNHHGSPKFCVQIQTVNDMTQQEMDDITALAAARFILVEFS